jgi:hypothetical protein
MARDWLEFIELLSDEMIANLREIIANLRERITNLQEMITNLRERAGHVLSRTLAASCVC